MKTIYRRCTVLDGTEEMEPRPDMTVVAEDGRIISVTKEEAFSGEGEVIDLEGRYLMPGLINLHVHLPGNGAPKKKQQDSTAAAKLVMKNRFTRFIGLKMCENYAKTELLSGVTTIRTVGGLGNFDTLIRDRINAGKLDGPRILASNMAVSVPGGHMTGSVAYSAGSEEECRALVRKIAGEKPDWIKLMITGGVLDAKVKGEPGVLKMPPSYVKACCEEAHKAGYRVAAHTESPEGVRTALENGVDTIEHGASPDEEIISLFKEKKACDICTISPAVPLAKFGKDIMDSTEMMRYNGNIVLEGIINCAKAALEHGIPVGLGTDTACPFVTHYDMWRELQYFHKYVGVSRAFALYTATRRNAEIAGIGQETGSIEPGKSADFLITEKNPLEDLTVLRTPYMVVARGKAFKKPVVKKYPICERELDKCLQNL
ncbi:amidohydrolase family protein [Qiania dongpingensis]|uniref:Amidohydrolase family protein n=1 Tax=Qiania dongpingensis TaxID=2763669 RepID=A0A7G9G207_9FIRM|nr:amidohydrolase family protein [Qiania dongpingensis]QNM04839.1 amidohydrolase family protein [Qiania dongpingensis]